MTEIQEEWQLLRSPANADASLIDLTSGGDFSQKTGGAIEIRNSGNGLVSIYDIFIAIAAGAAAGKTLTWRLFTWAAWNGMCQQVACGTAETGTQAVVKYPNGQTATDIFWCDTLAVTAFSWLKAVKATVGGGNNSVGMLSLQTFAWPWWFMQIEDADGVTGDEAGSVSVWWRRR